MKLEQEIFTVLKVILDDVFYRFIKNIIKVKALFKI